MLFFGFQGTFLIQHWLGVEGMPRRYADYLVEDGFTLFNRISTVGAVLLALSTLPFLWNVYITARKAPKVTVNDPWGFGGSLECATSCRRRATTSRQSHVFVRSAPPSTCITLRSQPWTSLIPN